MSEIASQSMAAAFMLAGAPRVEAKSASLWIHGREVDEEELLLSVALLEELQLLLLSSSAGALGGGNDGPAPSLTARPIGADWLCSWSAGAPWLCCSASSRLRFRASMTASTLCE